ncbi:DUF2637 domain-containing protein [Nocardia sp. CA-129566]|uniref:DUF2637 domain-containing protein n=1 Tax=Nocardia sp. CA-129566 TaxID=3239976 RepID=UPI003D961B7F
MATITSARSDRLEEHSAPEDYQPSVVTRLRAWRPRPLHASAIVTGIVALTSFEMSFAALHDLSVRNLVAPALAANVPIAIDGLVIGSIIATATFRRGSSAWWYATGLFVVWTLVSVAGNIEYAREIGGSPVSLSLYAGMPLTMLFAVHLTLMLFGRGRERIRAANPAPVPQKDRDPAPHEEYARAPQQDHNRAPQQNHTRAPEQNHTRAPQQNHAQAPQKDHAQAPQKDHTRAPQQIHPQAPLPDEAVAAKEDWGPAAKEDWDPAAEEEDWASGAEEEDWASAAEEDWDTQDDSDSTPPPERVVPTRIPVILENTDPLPVAPKMMLTSALSGTDFSGAPRIIATFATAGPNGQTKIDPF